MNKNKFRVWDPHTQSYQILDMGKSCQQFIGILDQDLKEIYEGDVVKFDIYQGEDKGVVRYYEDGCLFAIDTNTAAFPFSNISLESLKILGNINKDYIYDEKGQLTEKSYP